MTGTMSRRCISQSYVSAAPRAHQRAVHGGGLGGARHEGGGGDVELGKDAVERRDVAEEREEVGEGAEVLELGLEGVGGQQRRRAVESRRQLGVGARADVRRSGCTW